MKPLARWHIGNVKPDGYKCLIQSIESFLAFYDTDIIICSNANNLPTRVARFPVFQQSPVPGLPAPGGVAWKLYPPRLDLNRHEIIIDNDIVFKERIAAIDQFFASDCCLLLEGNGRTYGRFDKYVKVGYNINSGIFGMPAGFDPTETYRFYCGGAWERNAFGEHKESFTFDEQGLVALALLNYPRFVIIANTVITHCEHRLVDGAGHHFIGLNRRNFHEPFRLFQWNQRKTFL